MVTSLASTSLRLPMATLGPENPLPPLATRHRPRRSEDLDSLPSDMRENMTYGASVSMLPCLDQDGYDRTLVARDVPALVLENAHVRATVLPGLGGRLHSLVDIASGIELLYRPAALQFANLALRNAWFAGGVEWNLGSTGHWTGTCSPMHAARVDGPDGAPMVRLWEWERTRGLVMQLDFWLPDSSQLLFVGVRIRNPHDVDTPVYWWSNIAVPQSMGTRVLVPSDAAWHFGYSGHVDPVHVPSYNGFDLTYPMRHDRAADFFFDLGEPRTRPWICALDGSGSGLVQLSTQRLRGRKLFVWGEGRGGRRWQRWLAPASLGDGYAEIQAGLARTQMEHLRMSAGASWDWLEAYGRIDVASAHDPDWRTATAGVEDAVETLLPGSAFADAHARWRASADGAPIEMLAVGSGWGALELTARDRPMPGTPFGAETLGEAQRPWLALSAGSMPAADPTEPPGATLVAGQWRGLLEEAEDSWLVCYHRGVARWHAGEREAAVAAWRRSLAFAESAWALRCLGVAAATAGRADEAAELYLRAIRIVPVLIPLLIEALDALHAAARQDVTAEVLAALPPDVRAHGRVRLAEARWLLAIGDPAGAEAELDEPIELVDIREGENPLAELWLAVQAQRGTNRPLPAEYDFGMVGESTPSPSAAT